MKMGRKRTGKPLLAALVCIAAFYVLGYFAVRFVALEWKESNGRSGYVAHMHRFGFAAEPARTLYQPLLSLEASMRKIELAIYTRRYSRGYPLVPPTMLESLAQGEGAP